MTDAVLSFRFAWPDARTDRARTCPAPPRRSQPVFIHDAVTPWRGETLLLALLRADAERDQP